MRRKVHNMIISKLKLEGVQVEAKQMEGKRKRATSREGPCLRGNPRIFRVSSLFGGKDRHSKVCTIKGLRDRRIRLSAPTAIQLYDLQNKLGLSQPSKVIDWLIDVTRFEIDRIPPLHFPKEFDPNASFLHQSSMLLPQVCHFDVAMEAKNEETERLLVQKSSPSDNHLVQRSSPLDNHSSLSALQTNAMDENCCHFVAPSFPFPFMEANPASFSTLSLFYPLTAWEVSSCLPHGRN